ncbi:MAG: TRAP transporter substrate-binding protein [Nitrospiraceae bacterium]|nr:MAG: TRAP transporter substrate-binding protein [Nitrospiraceae bacterium]
MSIHNDVSRPVKKRFRGVEMRKKSLLVIWFTILGLAVASVLMFAACGDSSDTTTSTAGTPSSTAPTTAEQVLIRVTTPVPGGDEFLTWAQEGMDRFNARTNGAYKMEIFPGGQLGPFPESLDAIRTGAIEAGLIPLAAFGGSVPEFGLVELPFLFNNGEAAAYAMPSIQTVWDELSQAQANQRTLGCVFVGTANFLSTKKPLKTLDDLKGVIIGVDAPPMVELVNAVGGSGLVVDFTEDYSSLQKGIIDAKTSAPQYIYIAKLYEVAKYYTVFHGISGMYSFTVNSDVYNKMPKDIQDALSEELSATAASISARYVTKLYELEPVLTDLGMEFYYLPAAERDKWKALAYPGTLDALAKLGDVGSRVKQITDEANAKYPYTQQ